MSVPYQLTTSPISPIPAIEGDLTEVLRDLIESLNNEEISDLEEIQGENIIEDFLAASERFRVQKVDTKFKIMYRQQGVVKTELVESLGQTEVPRMPFEFIQLLVSSRATTYFELTEATQFPNYKVNVLIDFDSKSSFVNSILLTTDYPVLTTDNQDFQVQWGHVSNFESDQKALLYLNGKMGSSFLLDAFVVNGEHYSQLQAPYVLLGQDFLRKYLRATHTDNGVNYFYFEDSFEFLHKIEYYLVSDIFAGGHN